MESGEAMSKMSRGWKECVAQHIHTYVRTYIYRCTCTTTMSTGVRVCVYAYVRVMLHGVCESACEREKSSHVGR
jgi:hypothetical protein